MNASKTLTSIAAAVAMVGAIGYASAQSSATDAPAVNPQNPPAMTNTTETQQRSIEVAPNSQNAPATTDSMTTTPSTTTTGADATLDGERAPQADRN